MSEEFPSVPGRGPSGLAPSSAYKPSLRRQPNSMPSGGGGGGWKEMNEKMAASRAALHGEALVEGEEASGTSIFDPVLCELAYRWFCPAGGSVLDPFAGGSVRGIVASKLGRKYTGIDLQGGQLEANFEQAQKICELSDPFPTWICGDSRNVLKLVPESESADMIFSCPPYADLEVYSDDPNDLSTLGYQEFRKVYGEIIFNACKRLKNDRFACFVVGDVRGKDGSYYGFPWHTIEAFEKAGLKLYNEAVLVTATGSLAIRTRKQFVVTRKMAKTHQNILVFLKGDSRKAAQGCEALEEE